MSAIQQVLASGGGIPELPSKTAMAVTFDRYTQLSHAIAGSGIVNANAGILSFWIRLDGDSYANRYILTFGNGSFVIVNASNKFRFYVTGPTGLSSLGFTGTVSYMPGATWYHVLLSWDMNAAAGAKPKHFLINGLVAERTVEDSGVASVTDYTMNPAVLGHNLYGASSTIAELYFAPGQYLDFDADTHQDNILKFRNSLGHPVSLGADGSLPTGIAPAIYLPNGYTTFTTNQGSGNDLVVDYGALTAGSTSP